MQGSPGTGRVVHLARPNRPAVVAETLDELCGPTHGVVELPVRLMWNPHRRFDLDIDDLVATKVAALINRREVRDYIDVAAALRHYSIDQLLALAGQQDPGLEPDDIVEAGRYLDRLDDARFDVTPTPTTGYNVVRLRA